MKVLHLPSAVAGNAWGLATGERHIGLDAKVLVSAPDRFGFLADTYWNEAEVGKWKRLARSFTKWLKLRSEYDVFHFNSGQSLFHFPKSGLPLAELPWYPSKAKLFVTYNGCDARQKYPTMARSSVAACHDANCYSGVCNSGERDTQRKAAIEKMAGHVSHMWALNPDLLHFLPKGKSSFLPYTVSHFDELTTAIPDFTKKKLRIVHAPTNRAAKGTKHIEKALASLVPKYGKHFEVVFLEGLSHTECLAQIAQADLFIDQVLIGWYGGVAVEAMKMGKPVVCRIAKEDLRFIPPQMAREVEETILSAGPPELGESLALWLENRDLLKAAAERSREYAERWHRPETVALITKAAYEA